MSFIGLLSSAILLLFLFSAFAWFSHSASKEWKKVRKRRFKNKKKQKQANRICKQLEQKKRKQRHLAIVCFILCMLAALSAGYARYYQLTNLTAEDADVVAKSYYLVGEMEKQIKAIDNGASPEKTVKNLRNLSAQLASASIQVASQGMTLEGQKLLNKHFALTRNLAVNISNQTQETLVNIETRTTYLNDIAKVTESEQTIFNHFKVNESALKQNK